MKSYLAGATLLIFLGCAPTPTTATPVTPGAATTSGAPVAAETNRPAPTPPAVDQNGTAVDLAAMYKAGPVLVYFYPKADTPGCTAQACSLRDSYAKLTDSGLTVVGVSTDGQAAQKAFQEKYKLPFTLISDPDQNVLKAFGVSAGFGGFANREAFLVKGGVIVWHDSSASTAKQADDVLAQMATWKPSPAP